MNHKLLKYYHDELIMSYPAERQIEMTGVGCVGDFDNSYSMRRQMYIDYKVFDERQLQILDQFKKYLDKFNGHNEKFYWAIKE